jgi:hypothetical protein
MFRICEILLWIRIRGSIHNRIRNQLWTWSFLPGTGNTMVWIVKCFSTLQELTKLSKDPDPKSNLYQRLPNSDPKSQNELCIWQIRNTNKCRTVSSRFSSENDFFYFFPIRGKTWLLVSLIFNLFGVPGQNPTIIQHSLFKKAPLSVRQTDKASARLGLLYSVSLITAACHCTAGSVSSNHRNLKI